MQKLSDITHVPPLALKLMAGGLFMFWVVVPSAYLLRSGQIEYIPMVLAGGLGIIGMTIILAFIRRVILWLHFMFYWYLMGCWGLVVILLSVALVFGLLTIPPDITQTGISILESLNLILVPGAIFGIAVLIFVFRQGRAPQTIVVSPLPEDEAPKPKEPIDIIRKQIREREEKLGVDDER